MAKSGYKNMSFIITISIIIIVIIIIMSLIRKEMLQVVRKR